MTTWTPTLLAGSDTTDVAVYQWGPGILSGDILRGLPRGDLSDHSIQVSGTFGTATVNIQGSNDAISNSTGIYFNLHDPSMTIIALTAPGIVQVLELSAWLKPNIVGANGSTSLTITSCQRLK